LVAQKVSLAIAGLAMAVWAVWWFPRGLRSFRPRIPAGKIERFDAVRRSPLLAVFLAMMGLVGILLVILAIGDILAR
jgi:hypothetical protein